MHKIVEIKSNRLIILTIENDNYPIMFKKITPQGMFTVKALINNIIRIKKKLKY